MAYIGQEIKGGTFKVLDTSGNTYNGSNTAFNLGTQVGAAAQLLVSHDGVIQKPGTDYTLSSGGAAITFSTAPASGASIFIVEISGAVGGTITPADASVTADKLNTALLTGHTDIGADLADADLFLVDDGAGGTLRKVAASRLKTYNPGGTSWQSVVTSNTTMVAGRGYFVNTTSGAITMTLPSSASIGDTIQVIDYAATADSNNITIGRNSHKIQGDSADLTVSTERAAFTLVYVDSTQGWLLYSK